MPRNSSALISSPEIVSPIAFEMSAKFLDTPPNTDEIIWPIDLMADSKPKNCDQDCIALPIELLTCEKAVLMILDTRETVSPMAPMLSAITPTAVKELTH